ncbi:MAG: M15 family metallopeptidase [Clostridiales Family XIII bacterium]|jgi:D-alanyl-D-alanine carboxypeptidase|nr:M15 family metallopeptidase [Clostridiales Family XIII bacterium]
MAKLKGRNKEIENDDSLDVLYKIDDGMMVVDDYEGVESDTTLRDGANIHNFDDLVDIEDNDVVDRVDDLDDVDDDDEPPKNSVPYQPTSPRAILKKVIIVLIVLALFYGAYYLMLQLNKPQSVGKISVPEAGIDYAIVDWQDIEDANAYDIYIDDELYRRVDDSKIELTGLTPERQYQVAVVSVRIEDGKDDVFSGKSIGTVLTQSLALTIENFQVNATKPPEEVGIILSWTPVPDATSYVIETSADYSGEFTTLATMNTSDFVANAAGDFEYRDADVDTGALKAYKIRALYEADGSTPIEGNFSNILAAISRSATGVFAYDYGYVDISTIVDPAELLADVNRHKVLERSYTPEDLVEVDGMQLRKVAADAFTQLQDAAKDNNLNLVIVSAYRDYDAQSDIFLSELSKDPVNAYRSAAFPGFSEHQLGLALDVNVNKEASVVFADTPEYRWLQENAHKYGFVFSFTEANKDETHTTPEPWHIRYVGNDVSTKMYEDNIATLEDYKGE